MNKEILLLKYLDGELHGPAKQDLERLLARDPGTRDLLEKVRSQRATVLDHLQHLHSGQLQAVPEQFPMSGETLGRKRKVGIPLQWAAALILALVLVFALLEYIALPDGPTAIPDDPAKAPELFVEQEANDLDYAISPNRCWTKKQMIDFEIILKPQ